MSSLGRTKRRVVITFCHLVIAALALTGAFFLRFDFNPPAAETPTLVRALIAAVAIKLAVFTIAGCHRGSWRQAGLLDMVQVIRANVVASVLFGAVSHFLIAPSFPRSAYVIDFALCVLLMAAARGASRLFSELLHREPRDSNAKRILIYGTGNTVHSLVREIRANPQLSYHIVGIVEDDPNSKEAEVLGAPVVGLGRDTAAIVEQYRRRGRRIDEIVIALPSATGATMREALANCRAAGVPCKTIPGVTELLTGRVPVHRIRDVSVEDLLGREPVQLSTDSIRSSIEGMSVMVTGGGGSIGSEICRQVAAFNPRALIIFERAESDLFRIHWELVNRYPDLAIIPQIGDIREMDRLEEVIRAHRVNSIFHAAAFKHVPMMEWHLIEAVKNNILGTNNAVRAAAANGVSQFLMISSDKAVNPTNIMGLTKRVAELIVSSMPGSSAPYATKFVSVRFGNVLGSNGSVIPLFQQQIAAGGPVTVTHPDVRRYFMTVREAVQLVLQASTMGSGSEIFVLDMGEPVRILDLARNMIRLSGHEPGDDIEIRITGLRPGEKLFEELVLDGENIVATRHKDIRVYRGAKHDPRQIELWLARLELLLLQKDEARILRHLQELVAEYQPNGAWKGLLGSECSAEATSAVSR